MEVLKHANPGIPLGANDDRRGTANAGYAQAMVEHLQRQGHDPAQVLGDALPQVMAAPASQRVSAELCRTLMRRAVAHLRDPVYALRLAAHIEPRHLGLLGFLLMTGATLGEAALALQRYEPLLDSINTAQFDLDADACRLTWVPLVDDPLPDHIMLSMGVWAHQARFLTGRPDLRCDAEFSFSCPGGAEARALFEATFGGEVRFGCAHNRLIAASEIAWLPIRQANAEVHTELRTLAEQRLTSMALAPDTWQATVEHAIRRTLDGQRPTLEQVASLLGMAPRTLQARLDHSGVQFRSLVDKVMLARAQMLLRDRDRPLIDVALNLGFANQSSFQHAFKRWTGQTPGAWRQAQATT